MIEALERLTLVLWPPDEHESWDGWELVTGRGYTRRTNSVQPLAAGARPLEEKLRHCRRHFDARGIRTVYKLTEIAPAGLDAALDARGYRRGGETIVQCLSPIADDLRIAADVVIAERPHDDWFAACARLNGVEGDQREALRAILDRLPADSGFACVADPTRGDADPLAVALGSVAEGHVYIGEVVTAPRARRRGCARRAVEGLLAWARERGAQTAFLGVVVENVAARALYEGLGFREAYRYWYREAP